MSRQVRIMWFYVRQFVSVPYFVQLMALTTLAATLTQFLAWRAWQSMTPIDGWARGGTIGTWTTATCAAGIIGFERYKGTLVHLVMAPVGALRVLAAVVCSASLFGIAALPLSWVVWALASGSVTFTDLSGWNLARVVAGALMLLVGCVVMSLVVAALFVLTPNAIAYEGLILVPVLIASGLLFTAVNVPTAVSIGMRAIPLRLGYDVLTGRAVGAAELVTWCVVTLAWLIAARWLGERALNLATRRGSLELV